MQAHPPVAVQVVFGLAPTQTPAAGDWTDITQYVWEAHPRRGRQAELDRIEAGTANLVLDNRDRRFEPEFVAGPYYPNVRPLRRCRILVGENAHPNPSVEPGTSGWDVWQATGTQSLERALFGMYSYKVVSAGTAGGFSGMHTLAMSGATAGLVRTGSVYCYVPAGSTLIGKTATIIAREAGGASASGDTTVAHVLRQGWQRVSATRVFTANDRTLFEFHVYVQPVPTAGETFYLDGAQVTVGPHLQPYTSAQRALFTGFIKDWPPRYRGRSSEVQVQLVDLFEVLANSELTGSYSAQLSGARIGALLDAISWPAGDRALDAGKSQVQGVTLDKDAVLQHVQDVADTELGLFFMGGDGKPTFHDRHRRLTTPYDAAVAAFATAPNDVGPLYEKLALGLEPDYSIDQVRNVVTTTPQGAGDQVAQDAASKAEYFPRSLSRSTLHTTVNEAMDQSNALLRRYKDPAQRFDSLELDPHRDETLWDELVSRELSDRISLRHVPWPGGAAISRETHVEAISQDIIFRPGQPASWRGDFALSPVEPGQFWVLGHPTLSLLGSSTFLGY